MSFETTTKKLNHLPYLSAIKRMYQTKCIDEMKDYASFSQLERFRKELETLNRFGLHKELDIRIPSQQKESGQKISDGKVDVIFSAYNAKIKETYRNAQNKNCYQRKIRNAFIETIMCRTHQKVSYNKEKIPHCLNCGGVMEAEGEDYYCPYCHSHYQAEAYHYLITRFFIESVFHHLHYVLFILIFPFTLAILLNKGIISQESTEIISSVVGVCLSIFFLLAIAKGIKIYLRHQSVLQKVRSHDPHFSGEIFTMRLIDLLMQYPETLLMKAPAENQKQGVICHNFQHLQFCSYKRQDDLEIITCLGRVDALYLSGNSAKVHLQEKQEKMAISMARKYGTLTPIHYLPDQFTCPQCGEHQMSEHDGAKVCCYCQAKIPAETIDWILYPQPKKYVH